MNIKTLSITLAGSLLLFSACKKTSPISIDNDQVIQTPYSLFVANTFGHLLKTNDGDKFYSVYPSDGFAPKALLFNKTHLLIAKKNLHLSYNEGKNFTEVYDKMRTYDYQSFLANAAAHNRLYVTSTQGDGVAYSENNGLTWITDTQWAPLIPKPFEINSFAAHNDGSLYAFSNKNLILFKKATVNDNWTPVTIEGIFPVDESGYFISSEGGVLFLLDHYGTYHHFMSTDGGNFWTMIASGDLPRNKKIYTVGKSQNGLPLIGTEDAGMFTINGGKFVKNSNGLETNTSVYRIVNKQNIYKNGVIKNFSFALTNKGIYRSSDEGVNWNRMTDTTFQHQYVAGY